MGSDSMPENVREVTRMFGIGSLRKIVKECIIIGNMRKEPETNEIGWG